MTHALTRTSPKGEGEVFIGRCVKCGQENLVSEAALEPCPQDGMVDEEQVLVDLITGDDA